MKRYLTLSAALVLILLPLKGQDFSKGQWDVKAGAVADFSGLRLMDDSRSEYRLSDIYSPYISDTYSSVPIYVSATWRLNKTFSFGLSSVFGRTIGTITDPMTLSDVGEKTENALLLAPKAEIRYWSWNWGGFYGSIGAGAVLYFGKDGGKGYLDAEPYVEVVPYGFWLGGKVYWFYECFFGTSAEGIRTGLGYRF